MKVDLVLLAILLFIFMIYLMKSKTIENMSLTMSEEMDLINIFNRNIYKWKFINKGNYYEIQEQHNSIYKKLTLKSDNRTLYLTNNTEGTQKWKIIFNDQDTYNIVSENGKMIIAKNQYLIATDNFDKSKSQFKMNSAPIERFFRNIHNDKTYAWSFKNLSTPDLPGMYEIFENEKYLSMNKDGKTLELLSNKTPYQTWKIVDLGMGNFNISQYYYPRMIVQSSNYLIATYINHPPQYLPAQFMESSKIQSYVEIKNIRNGKTEKWHLVKYGNAYKIYKDNNGDMGQEYLVIDPNDNNSESLVWSSTETSNLWELTFNKDHGPTLSEYDNPLGGFYFGVKSHHTNRAIMRSDIDYNKWIAKKNYAELPPAEFKIIGPKYVIRDNKGRYFTKGTTIRMEYSFNRENCLWLIINVGNDLHYIKNALGDSYPCLYRNISKLNTQHGLDFNSRRCILEHENTTFRLVELPDKGGYNITQRIGNNIEDYLAVDKNGIVKSCRDPNINCDSPATIWTITLVI